MTADDGENIGVRFESSGKEGRAVLLVGRRKGKRERVLVGGNNEDRKKRTSCDSLVSLAYFDNGPKSVWDTKRI